jgi:hypothetical protein
VRGRVPPERVFQVPNTDGYKEPGKEEKPPKKNRPVRLHGLRVNNKPVKLQPDTFTASGLPAASTPVLKALAGKNPRELLNQLDAVDADAADAAEATEAILQKAAKVCGRAFDAFGGGRRGLEACAAFDALCDIAAIDTLLSSFILPLQVRSKLSALSCHSFHLRCSISVHRRPIYISLVPANACVHPRPTASSTTMILWRRSCAAGAAAWFPSRLRLAPTLTVCMMCALCTRARGYHGELRAVRDAVWRLQGDDLRGKDDRIHCSLNINTETGRLSARRPNLQNQPALEKDRRVRRSSRSSYFLFPAGPRSLQWC